MNLIKLTTKEGKKVIVNIANISYWYGLNETETTIVFIDSESFLTITMSIDEFANKMASCDKSRIIWEV